MRKLLLGLGALLALTVAAAPALAAGKADAPKKLDVFLYVDTVNGSSPVGVPRRPIGCTQTNNFKRGEQVVFRIWGSEAENGAILNTENVQYAYVKIPGGQNLKLNWGPHGAASNRVWFWTAWWVIPADYPLGAAQFRVVFKTEAGTFGTYDHTITITPATRKKR